MFIHGLWLLPSSWDRWAAAFKKACYTTLTPGWPDDPETVQDASLERERPLALLPYSGRPPDRPFHMRIQVPGPALVFTKALLAADPEGPS